MDTATVANAFAVMAGDREIARLSSLGEATSYALEVHESKRFIDLVRKACEDSTVPAVRKQRIMWMKHIQRARKNGLGATGVHIRPIY